MISGLPFVTKLTFKRAKASRWTYTTIPKCQSKNFTRVSKYQSAKVPKRQGERVPKKPKCQSGNLPECQSTKAPKHQNGHANVRQRRNLHEASAHVETNDKFVKHSDHDFFF